MRWQTAVRDLNASKGVIFTTVGFQSGTEETAKHYGIDIFVVRDLADEEWGRPVSIELYLQCCYRAIGNVQFPGLKVYLMAPSGRQV